MSYVHYHSEPELRNPVLIAAFGGWNDAADSATTAIKFLNDRWKPAKLANIDGEDFFIFTETRPTIRYVDGIERSLTWPTNQFTVYQSLDLNRDVILYLVQSRNLSGKRLRKTSCWFANITKSQRSFYWALCWLIFLTLSLYPFLARRLTQRCVNDCKRWMSITPATKVQQGLSE